MKVLINGKAYSFEGKNVKLKALIDKTKPQADLFIINGFPVNNASHKIFPNDEVYLLKKGEHLSIDEIESLLIARHSPRIHNKIKKAKIGIAGIGGLGSNLIMALVRLGISEITYADFDIVDPTNLNRQHYFVEHIGMNKTDALEDMIKKVNPHIKINKFNEKIENRKDIEKIFKNCDIVAECFDNKVYKKLLVDEISMNFPEKYVISVSGVAGFDDSQKIKIHHLTNRVTIIGDLENEAKENMGLMSPRVTVASGHMANEILNIILNIY
ncbi:sulfur carrier protein ThiS adenylyltransferase ThiF [bacterium]|nr:sulfur carrier protein ThiS adenylyltransferase ThiF [bacterium]